MPGHLTQMVSRCSVVFALSPLAVDEPLVQDYKLLALAGRVLAAQREPRAHERK